MNPHFKPSYVAGMDRVAPGSVFLIFNWEGRGQWCRACRRRSLEFIMEWQHAYSPWRSQNSADYFSFSSFYLLFKIHLAITRGKELANLVALHPRACCILDKMIYSTKSIQVVSWTTFHSWSICTLSLIYLIAPVTASWSLTGEGKDSPYKHSNKLFLLVITGLLLLHMNSNYGFLHLLLILHRNLKATLVHQRWNQMSLPATSRATPRSSLPSLCFRFKCNLRQCLSQSRWCRNEDFHKK